MSSNCKPKCEKFLTRPSMIRDLYDNSIVAYKTGTEQTVNLVLDTIHLAMRQEKNRVTAELQLHSDRAFNIPLKHISN